MKTDSAYIDILEERERQDNKWGVQNHDPKWWLAILTEEVGEVARAILEGSGLDYRKELVQCAAVCINAIECVDRNGADVPGITAIVLENAALKKKLLEIENE